MSRGGQSLRVLESAVRDQRLHKLARPKQCPCCGQSVSEHSTPEIRARAAAEWDAMDDRGQLPDGWEYRP